MICGLRHWQYIYYQKQKKTKQGIKILRFKNPTIIVPLDSLIISERQIQEKYHIFFATSLNSLTDRIPELENKLLKEGWDLLIVLEIIKIISEYFLRKFKEEKEKFLEDLIISFSHELGHWRLLQKMVGKFIINCPIIINNSKSCFLEEIYAYLEGRELLKELDLLKNIKQESILDDFLNAKTQCNYCVLEIIEGRCPAKEEWYNLKKKLGDSIYHLF